MIGISAKEAKACILRAISAGWDMARAPRVIGWQSRFAAILTGTVFTFLLLSSASAAADERLQRRPYLGLAVETLPAERRNSLNLPPDQGVLVARVFPRSSASEIGMVQGDIVLKLNDVPIATPEQLIRVVKSCKTGESLRLAALRQSARIEKTCLLKPFPCEESPDFDTIYGELVVDGTLRRTIVTRPRKPGKYPAVLLVGGIGCYSMDYPLDDKRPYKQLLYGLTRKNIVTMRIEKSGVGDSLGPPCAEEDFYSQVRAYGEAIKSMQQAEFIDSSKLFVLGHSIGGIIAPMLAATFPLAGIIVADTVGISWFEYELANSRRQKTLSGLPAEQIDERLRAKELCLHCLLVDKQSPERIAKEHPDCSEYLQYPAHYVYMQQVAALNLPQIWKAVPCPVLIVYGTSDYVTSDREHEFIFDQVNAVHPGKGTLVRIHGMDHSLARATTVQESLARSTSGKPAQFNSSIVPVVYKWLHGVSVSRGS
jgi:uncharacterized protein